MFAWDVKAKHCWVLSANFFFFKSLLTMPGNVLPSHLKQTFLLIIRVFHWRLRWWDLIQATFYNFFSFTANFEKHCTAKIACMMAVILLNLNLGLQDSLSSEPCVLNLLKIYFARLHALVRICSLLSMPRFSLGFQASVWLFGIEID